MLVGKDDIGTQNKFGYNLFKARHNMKSSPQKFTHNSKTKHDAIYSHCPFH